MAESKLAIYNKLLKKNGISNWIDGVQVPFFVQQEDLDKLKSFQLYSDDVFVVTYPKCGTTWMQQIVRLINNGGAQDNVRIDKAVPWLEDSSVFTRFSEGTYKLRRPRAFKSHMPYDLCPCGPPNTTPCKYIYVMRNPKDVAVSFYFHNKRNPVYPVDDWDTFWKKYIEGNLDFGNYFDHVLSWWPHRNDKNVLFLKYEDMKKDLPAAVSRVASFMGINLSDDVIAKIAALTEFSTMKNDDSANYSHMDPVIRPNTTDFLRRGTVGDWKNFLTPKQSAQIDSIYERRLKKVGLEFEFILNSKL